MTSHGCKQNEISQELSLGTKIFKTSYYTVIITTLPTLTDWNFLTFSLFRTGMRWKILFVSTRSNLDSTTKTPKIISTTLPIIWPASVQPTATDPTFADLPISEVPSSTELCLCGTTFLKIWNPPPLLPHSNINWRTTTGTNLKHSLTLIVQGHGKPFVLNVVLVLLLVVHDSWERSKLSLHFQNVFCFSLFE
jgi:hypothetical protein